MIEISGVRIKKDGKTLLLHRKKWDHWELPGGTVEPTESPRKTAIRETKEEIGVDVEILRELDTVDFEIGGKNVRSYQYIAKIISGEPKLMEPDIHDDIGFFDLETQESLAPNITLAGLN